MTAPSTAVERLHLWLEGANYGAGDLVEQDMTEDIRELLALVSPPPASQPTLFECMETLSNELAQTQAFILRALERAGLQVVPIGQPPPPVGARTDETVEVTVPVGDAFEVGDRVDVRVTGRGARTDEALTEQETPRWLNLPRTLAEEVDALEAALAAKDAQIAQVLALDVAPHTWPTDRMIGWDNALHRVRALLTEAATCRAKP